MWTAAFELDDGAIYVDVRVHGPNGIYPAHFLLDTGAHRTAINVAITDDLGYGAHMATLVQQGRCEGSGKDALPACHRAIAGAAGAGSVR